MFYKKLIKLILKVVVILILTITGYLLIVSLAGYIPVNNSFTSCNEKDCVTILLVSNGVHTDIVVPVKTQFKDWSKLINDSDFDLVAFGWGDKGFYIETPTWADLKFKTAFNALFFLSTSAMHVTLYKTNNFHDYRSIDISSEQYKSICDFIELSFQKDENNNFKQIICKPYGLHDKFYEANGTYNLFYTCNTWTNNCLKSADLPACIWTLFDGQILDKYE